eukprot:TRINITY_DN16313_c0_g2_i1.p1 TRINITY_DN16313_c0_g2~~TRINITY_DN16313_c0_g2_i1.p1  ORF type:complete len:1149 (+),score=351.67 TRINITY_DN16313_c0_g2_i1:50-3496(+)
MRRVALVLLHVAAVTGYIECQLKDHNIVSELQQQQFELKGTHEAIEPTNDAFNVKHTPILSIAGREATVRVGTAAIEHPTVVSDNEDLVHFITALFVVDQTGRVVSLHEYVPEKNGQHPVLEFVIPKGADVLTPFAMCNQHGLFRGINMTVQDASQLPPTCVFPNCHSNSEVSVPFSDSCGVFTSVRAERKRRHKVNLKLTTPPPVGGPGLEVSVHSSLAIVVPPILPQGADPTTGFIDAAWLETETGLIIAAATFTPGDDFHFDAPLPGKGELAPETYQGFIFHTRAGLFATDVLNATSFNVIDWRKSVQGCNRCILRSCHRAHECDEEQSGMVPHPPIFVGPPVQMTDTVPKCTTSNVSVQTHGLCHMGTGMHDLSLGWRLPSITLGGDNRLHIWLFLQNWTPAPARRWVGVAFPTVKGHMSPAWGMIYSETGRNQPNPRGNLPGVFEPYNLTGISRSQVVPDQTLLAKYDIQDIKASVNAVAQTLHLEFSVPLKGAFLGDVNVNVARNTDGSYLPDQDTSDNLLYHGPDGRTAMVINFSGQTAKTETHPKQRQRECSTSNGVTGSTVPNMMVNGSSTFMCMKEVPGMPGATVHWDYNPYTHKLYMGVHCMDTAGWVGLGLRHFNTTNPHLGMAPAEALILSASSGSPDPPGADWYHISEATPQGVQKSHEHAEEADILWKFTRDNGHTFLHFEMTLTFVGTVFDVLVARSLSDTVIGFHGQEGGKRFYLDVMPLLIDVGSPVTVMPPNTSPPTPTAPATNSPVLPPPDSLVDFTCDKSPLPAFVCVKKVGRLSDVWLHWTYNYATEMLYLHVVSQSTGWLGVTFPQQEGKMSPADGVIYRALDLHDGTGRMEVDAVAYTMNSYAASGVVEDRTARDRLNLTSLFPLGWRINGFTVIELTTTVPHQRADRLPINIARSEEDLRLGAHSMNEMVGTSLNLREGVYMEHKNKNVDLRKTHAGCMVAAFGFLLPIAVIVKHYGQDLGLGEWAFYIHIGASGVAFILIFYAFEVAAANFNTNRERDYGDHNQAGYYLFGALVLQPLLGVGSALILQQDPKEISVMRSFHKVFGYCIGLAGLFQCFSGFEKLKVVLRDDSSTRTTLEVILILAILFYFCLVPFLEIRRRRNAAAASAAAHLSTAGSAGSVQ